MIHKLSIEETLDEAVGKACKAFITQARNAISERGAFFVALSGGSTPKALYIRLATVCRESIDWSKVHLFWSDERCVPLTSNESNYKMAMDAGFSTLPIPKDQIHPFQDGNDYEELIEKTVPGKSFDLVLLGLGEDGHTASLFPKTHALKSDGRLAEKNFLPDHDVWRLTLTFKAINQAKAIIVLATGRSKAEILNKVLKGPVQIDLYPVQGVGQNGTIAHFIIDRQAAALL